MNKLSNCFTFFITIYVIFNRYASPIPKVTLSEFILLLFWMLFFISGLKKFRIEWSLIPFCIYLIGYIIVPFTGILSYIPDMVDLVGTAARLLFIYFSIAILGKSLFNLEKGINFIRYTATILSVYACLQIIASKFGVYLTTYIPYLPIMSDFNIDQALLEKASYGLAFRPCSLLTEPAALSIYLLCALVFELFLPKHKYQYFNACLFSTVCILSRSSTGIIMVILVWGLFFIKYRSKNAKQFFMGLIIAIIIVIFSALLIYYSGIWNYFLDRTFQENRFGDFSSSTRFYAIKDMFAASDSIIGVLFGQGLSNIDNYLPGFARSYLNLGLVGVLIMLFMLIRIYSKGNSLQKKILFLFVILNIGTEIILGPFALLFLCFVISKKTSKNGEVYVT